MAQLPGSARVAQYTATAGQPVFIYDFKIYDDDEITVQSDDTTLTLTTDYTVQDAGEEAGGTITLVVGATAGTIITLTGNSMIERDTVFINGGDYNAEAINGEYDKLDDITSEIVTDQGQNFRLEVYSETVSTTIPNPTANRCLVWNSDGDGLENSTYDPDAAQTDAAVSAAEAAASALLSSGFADDAEASASSASTSAASSWFAASVASGFADDAEASAIAAAASAASIDWGNVEEDILPSDDSTYDLGSTTKAWAEAHVDDVICDTLTIAGTEFILPTEALFADIKANNTPGGPASALTWNTRDLNTEEKNDITGCSLSTNQITLAAGSYYVEASAPAYEVDGHQLALYNITDTSYELLGTSSWTELSADVQTSSVIKGFFTIGASKVFELKHYTHEAKLSVGLGISTVSGQNERYTHIYIRRDA